MSYGREDARAVVSLLPVGFDRDHAGRDGWLLGKRRWRQRGLTQQLPARRSNHG